ncbi:cellulose biosynthesis protein BcsS, partial [Methylobacterium organophilum]|nr:cellulose biosynthesis protein BcsS [Methylobacterium organophilum]
LAVDGHELQAAGNGLLLLTHTLAQAVVEQEQHARLDALVGPDSVLSGFVGLAVRRDEVAQSGLTETVARTGVGLKTALDYYARPTAFTMFHATGTYSTAFNAYYGRVRFGIAALAGGYVGPEFAALGDDYYRQWRVGAHLSGMQIGAVQLGLSAGYVHDHVRKGGLYTALDMRTGF